MIINSRLENLNLNNKRVFLRVDLNVELIDKKILSDFKLNAILPTLNLLIKKNAKIILATHIDEPNPEMLSGNISNDLSTKIIANWFENIGYKMDFEPNLKVAINKSRDIDNKNIILLENLRFYKGEKSQDLEFAKRLKCLADFYVGDAFGLIHRADTSVNILPKLFDLNHKAVGLLIEKEVKNLDIFKVNLKKRINNESIAILGGGKVKDKLPLIKPLLDIFDKILICPALVFTFLKAENKNVGKSLIDSNLITEALNILKFAEEKNKEIVFPLDYQVLDLGCSKLDQNFFTNFKEHLKNNIGKIRYIETFKENYIGLSIGPKSLSLFNNYIFSCDDIFLNGAMGFLEAPETLRSFDMILDSISKSKAFSLVAGGDSVARVYQDKLSMNFCSTGGGATLTYLVGKPLLGLYNIIN